MRFLYTLTIFLNSALLFLVQPMIAKMILPRFGGSSQVWTASMLFFQIVLLLGYLYAHFSTKLLGKRQPVLHLALMGAAALTLPFVLPPGLAAKGGADPTPALLALLAISVGASFFVVSAGAPLLQRWFANTGDKDAKDPYFLYSASNLGSMLALLAYPFFIEPRLRLAEQTRLWRWIFLALMASMAVSAIVMWRAHSAPAQENQETPPAETKPVTSARRWRWILLAAVPSSLMLGTTSYLTVNIAPMPLIWVVPLSLYLLTYILAFMRKPLMPTAWLERGFSLVVVPLALMLILEAHNMELAFIHITVFFIAAWMCHQLLADDRPDASRLTEFYVFMSIGGMLGGLFNAVLAPTFFNNLYEYPIALVGAVLLRPALTPKGRGFRWGDLAYGILIAGLTYLLLWGWDRFDLNYGNWRTAVTAGIPAILAYIAVDRSYRFGLALAGIFVMTFLHGWAGSGQVLSVERSFYGVHRVTSDGVHNKMVHGNTIHGMQFREGPNKDMPLTYYFPSGPMGQLFRKVEGSPLSRNVALVGLGVGSLAAYGEPGDQFTFYEIDPLVEKMARNPELFTFLEDSSANVNVVLGDARLTLADAPDGNYGVIVLDAFTSDAIPIHLLTREAIAMYMSKLAPNGLLALHISNRYLRLEDVVAASMRDLGLVGIIQADYGVTDEEREMGKTPSKYIILARQASDLERFKTMNRAEVLAEQASLPEKLRNRAVPDSRPDNRWEPLVATPAMRAWTDDYSNILSVWEYGQ